jgi:hypothetical protein
MTNLDTQLARLSPILVAGGSRLHAPAPFEAASRTYCGVTYTITLNFSHNPASLNGSGFAAYQVEMSPSPPDPLPACSPNASGSGPPATPGIATPGTSAGSSGVSAGASPSQRLPKRRMTPRRRRRSSSEHRTNCARARPVKCKRVSRCATDQAKRSSRTCKAGKLQIEVTARWVG